LTLLILSINKWFLITIIVLILLFLYLFICYWIYRSILVDFNNPPVDLVDQEEDFYKNSYKWFQEIPKEDIYITSYDSLKLHGYYIPSMGKKSNNLAIVVHGYQSKATDMIIIGQMYVKMGFQVILIDLRGHGLSEGSFTTFGFYEKYDLKKWINYALHTYGADLNILIHGVSMGAASAMMVTGLDIPNNVKFLLLDSGFTSVKKTFTNARKNKVLRIFFPGLNLIIYSKHKFILNQVNPEKYMRKNTIPFLIVQGGEDKVVPISMGERLLNVSPAGQKEMIIIDEAKHALGFYVDFDKCQNEVFKNIKDVFKIKKIYKINE